MHTITKIRKDFEYLTAEIKAIEGKYFIILTNAISTGSIFSDSTFTGSITLKAKRAFSCIVEPEVGDKVAIFSADSDVYITSILEREAGSASRLSFENDVHLSSRAGKVILQSKETISIVSNESVSVVAPSYHVVSKNESHQTEKFNMTATKACFQNETTVIKSNSVNMTVKTMLQNLVTSIRNVKLVDQLYAGSWIAKISNTHNLQTKNSIQVAENDFKIDAKRIHMG